MEANRPSMATVLQRGASLAGGALFALLVGRKSRTHKLLAVGGFLLLRRLIGHKFFDSLGEQNRRRAARRRGVTVVRSLVVNRSLPEVFALWRESEGLPRFLQHVDRVIPINRSRSRWIGATTAGDRVEWDVEIVEEIPDRRLAWRSAPGSRLMSSGSVTLRGSTGTALNVELSYRPAKPEAEPESSYVADLEDRILEDLRRFRRFAESHDGELPDAVDITSEDSMLASDPPGWAARPTRI